MSVCLSVCPRECIRNTHARSLPIFVHAAYVRGSVHLRHVDDRPHRLSAGRGDGSAQCGLSVIYDCLVVHCIMSRHFIFDKEFSCSFVPSLAPDPDDSTDLPKPNSRLRFLPVSARDHLCLENSSVSRGYLFCEWKTSFSRQLVTALYQLNHRDGGRSTQSGHLLCHTDPPLSLEP